MAEGIEAYRSHRETTGKHTARRQQVIDAAAATFARTGYQGASTRAIADTLGIKVASLYFHIASKEEALAEICLLGIEQPLLYLAEALREGDTLASTLRLFFAHQRHELITHADYITVSIRERQHLGSAAQRRISDLTARLRAEVDGMFQRAIERAELSPALTTRQARFIVIGTMRSISELYISGPVRNFDDIATAWVETIIRGMVTDYTQPPERVATVPGTDSVTAT